MSDSYYDLAQICDNGHVINSMAYGYPQSNQNFCDRCGAKTTTQCPECLTNIRGYYHVPGVFTTGGYDAPSYCFNCRAAYPWTQSSLEAANKLADETESLTKEGKEQLKRSLSDLIREGPKTVIAETRFKKLMKKAGKDTYDAMRSILVDVVSEAVKKSVFGG